MQQQLNISLDKTTGIKCDKCENEIFQEGMMLRKASRFLTGTEQDALIPIPVFACSKCGYINDEFLPMQLRNKFEEAEIVDDKNTSVGSFVPLSERKGDEGAKVIKMN